MVCPFRINTISEVYKNDSNKRVSRSEYAECVYTQCPLYMTVDGNSYCARILKEYTTSVHQK